MAIQHGGGQPRLSPDGQWWWNGREWISSSAHVLPLGQPEPLEAIELAAQAPRRLPHQTPRFWMVGGSVVAALVLLSVSSTVVSNRPGTLTSRRAAAEPTPAAEVAVSTPTPTPVPTPSPTATPTSPVATAPPAHTTAVALPGQRTAPAPARPASTCGAPANPWGYNFCGGTVIPSPNAAFCQYFDCIPSFWKHTRGYVMMCDDGRYSHSGGVAGSCKGHGGDRRALLHRP